MKPFTPRIRIFFKIVPYCEIPPDGQAPDRDTG